MRRDYEEIIMSSQYSAVLKSEAVGNSEIVDTDPTSFQVSFVTIGCEKEGVFVLHLTNIYI